MLALLPLTSLFELSSTTLTSMLYVPLKVLSVGSTVRVKPDKLINEGRED